MAVKEKRPPKTIKEKRFVKEYIKTGNATEAAARVYNVQDRDTARNIGSQNVAKLSIVEMMDKVEGLRPVDRLKCLAEGLYANKQISGVGDANGKSMEFVEVPDYANRYKYLELSFKLDGSLGKSDDGATNNFFQFIQNQKNEYNG